MAALAEASRRRLLRWASWFAVANAALLAIIGLRYLWLYVRLSPSVAWGYAVVAYVGHMSALAYLPCLLVLMPVILLSPRPRLVVPLGVALGGVGEACCCWTAWSSRRTDTISTP